RNALARARQATDEYDLHGSFESKKPADTITQRRRAGLRVRALPARGVRSGLTLALVGDLLPQLGVLDAQRTGVELRLDATARLLRLVVLQRQQRRLLQHQDRHD